MAKFVILENGREIRTFCENRPGVVRGFLVFSADLDMMIFEIITPMYTNYVVKVLGGVLCTAAFCQDVSAESAKMFS